MNVSFRLGSGANGWSQGSVTVYYSDDDYDVFPTQKYQQSSSTYKYSTFDVEVTFRGNPIGIVFNIQGYDTYDGGAGGYVQNIFLAE